MATTKVAHRTMRADRSVSKRRINKTAPRAPSAAAVQSKADSRKDTAETVEARAARIGAERQMLANTVPGSLASKLRQLLGQGYWIDEDAPDPMNGSRMSGSFDHALIRAAAVQLRALALALGHDPQGESRLSPDLVLSDEDTAFALASISVLLAVGSELADDIRAARGYGKA